MFDSISQPTVDWMDIPPGPRLAALLAEAEQRPLDDGELFEVVRGYRRLAAWAQAGEMAAVAHLAMRRPPDPCQDPAPPRGHEDDDPGQPVGEFFVSELAAGLTITQFAAQKLIRMALCLAERLPGTAEALRQGKIDWPKAHALVQGTECLRAAKARQVENQLLGKAPGNDTAQLRRRVRRAAIKADPDPDAARHRRDRAVKSRRVELRHTDDHTIDLAGRDLPAAPALAAHDRIDALAKHLKMNGDQRGINQIRTDVYLALLLGSFTDPAATTLPTPQSIDFDQHEPDGWRRLLPDGWAQALQEALEAVGSRVGAIQVNVPLTTLTQDGTNPGHVPGYGPLLADVARELAEAATAKQTRWCVMVTDDQGNPIQHGQTSYRPSPALHNRVIARDQTCSYPGCNRSAIRWCDLDHTIPHGKDGPTCGCNLGPLCRKHHRLKQHYNWRLEQIEPGVFMWTTPTGHKHAVRPEASPI